MVEIGGCELQNIDLKNNINLTHLTIEAELEQINLESCKNLLFLDISDNKIEKLNLKNCPKLVGLDISNNKLKELDLSANEKISQFSCYGNIISCEYLIKKYNLEGAGY